MSWTPSNISGDNASNRKIVKFDKKIRRRFYEAIIFLRSLTQVYGFPSVPKTNDDSNGYGSDLLRCFLWKLAMVCDNDRGPTTISAIAVLDGYDKLQYVLASNQRNMKQLEEARSFLTNLLGRVKQLQAIESAEKQSANDKRDTLDAVLDDILAFNFLRVKFDTKQLAEHLVKCIELCDSNKSSEYLQLKEILVQLLDDANPVISAPHDTTATKNLIRAIGKARKTSQYDLLSKKAKGGYANAPICWGEVNHRAGRLCSFRGAAEAIIAASGNWPQLFDEFEVLTIPKSTCDDSPLLNKTPTAEEIVGRMAKPEEVTRIRELASEMDRIHNIDENIKAICNESTRPFVHCEILLLNWLEKNKRGLRPERFFQNVKYIGVSKPPCRLCAEYFSIHHGDVKVREGHGNIYLNWRFPDIYSDQGEIAVANRTRMANGIIEKIRSQVKRTMEEKTASWRPHDSETHSNIPSGAYLSGISSIMGGPTPAIDDVLSQGMQEVTLTQIQAQPAHRFYEGSNLGRGAPSVAEADGGGGGEDDEKRKVLEEEEGENDSDTDGGAKLG